MRPKWDGLFWVEAVVLVLVSLGFLAWKLLVELFARFDLRVVRRMNSIKKEREGSLEQLYESPEDCRLKKLLDRDQNQGHSGKD